MRILHVMAGAKNGGSEAIMLSSVLALGEAGVAQHVVTRGDDALRLRSLDAAQIPYSVADFDKIVRAPTLTRIRAAARAFEPDILHFWLGRAAGFAQPKWRHVSVGWHGARHRIAQFKNCAWHAVAAPALTQHLTENGVKAERTALLAPFAAAEPEAAPCSREHFATPEHAILMIAPSPLGEAWDAVIDALARFESVHLWHSEPLPARAAAMANRFGFQDRLHHASGAPRAQLIAAADIALCAASDTALDGALIEAWAQKKPVIAIGESALAQHETDALIAAPHAEALAQAFQRLISQADLAQRLSENGRRTYRARFTKSAFVQNAMALYERVRSGADAKTENEAAL